MKLKISSKIFGKYSNFKFNENLSSERLVVSCKRMDGQTNMRKLTVAFSNFANIPKNYIPMEKFSLK